MTNKQIIIDGIDVSGCIYFKMNNKMPMCRACNSGLGTPYCEYHKDCYYKNWKRKEQECEELKEATDGLLKIQYQLANSCTKYEQTLAEIKEIAEQISLPMGIGKSSNRVILAKQILQKINECEVEQ